MKTSSKILLSVVAAMLLCIVAGSFMSAETVVVWQPDEAKAFAGWSDKLQLTASELGEIAAGDIVTVHVSEIDAATTWPQIHLRQYGGTAFDPKLSVSVKGKTAPCDVTFEIDETVAAEATANGLSIAGIGFTANKVSVTYPDAPAPPVEMVEVEVTRTLWSGEQVVSGWSGAQVFTAAMCSGFKAGDRIAVTVTAVSGTDAQVDLRNGAGWANFTPGLNETLTDATVPGVVTFVLSEDVVATVKSNGMVVTGNNFTFTKVERITTEMTLPSASKGNAARTVWEGREAISWTSGQSNSVLIAAADLGPVAEGNIVRVYYTDMKPGGTGRLLANWTALDGQANATLLGARYYEYVLSASNATAIGTSGLRLSGTNYTATRVDIIDPARRYLLLGEIDRADIRAWEATESPDITLTLRNCETVDVEALVEVDIDLDRYEDYCEKSETVTIAAGAVREITIPYDLEPGFYNLNVYVNGDNVCSYVIGCNPKGVVSPPDANLDAIKAYWDHELEILRNIPVDATLTEIPSASTANRKVYLVQMKSTPDEYGGEPVEIRGFYAEPTGEGTYPALIQYQGTDGGSSTIKPINGDDNIGWCELVISTRGQMLNNRSTDQCEWAWLDPAYDDDRAASGSNKIDYYAHGLNDKEHHYYRGANVDCIRAIDFIASRPKTNTDNIFAVGGSQGGSFVYVAAALGGGRIRACAPSITGHSDFRDGAGIVNWPKSVFDRYLAENPSVSEDELYEFLSYYDVMNLAAWVECPVLTSFSLQDRTDPPHINVAPFNNVPRSKVSDENLRYVVNPFLGHGTASEWKADYMRFFNEFRTDLAPVDPLADINLWSGECVTGNWEGYQVIDASQFATVKAGDYIAVSVSEVGVSPCLMLNNGAWAALVDADAVVPQAPGEVRFLITHDMLAELKTGGLVVKGCNLTFVSVDIRRGEELVPDDPDAPVRKIWSGASAIDWNKGEYVTVAPAKFGNVRIGDTLRFVYAALAAGAQAHLNCGWNSEGHEIVLPGATDYIRLRGNSYTVEVTQDMLAALKSDGLNIVGVGHTLTEVQAIDYSRLPDVTAAVADVYRYFGKSDTPSLAVTLTGHSSVSETVAVTLNLRHDDYTAHKDYAEVTKTVTVEPGVPATVDFEMNLEPGVYHYVLTANYREIADANIASDLEGIVSPPDAEEDFEQFWTDALAELGAVEPEYRLTRLDEYSSAQRTVYMVEMKSVPDKAGAGVPVTVRGYLAEPVAAGSYPAVITYQGYDSNPETQQYIPRGDANPDRIDFVLSTRGQGINNRGEYKAANEYYGDWFMYGFGNRDSYYYRGAYMDAVRAFDLVCSRDKTDRRNIFGEGHSQGGALTYAAAALVAMRSAGGAGQPTFNSIAPAIPFMGDFPDYFRIGEWPSAQAYAWLNAQTEVSEAQMYGFLSYFDTKNLAVYVDSHLITAVGLQDETCPAHTNIAPYNIVRQNPALDTRLIVNPALGHQAHDSWERDLNDFFNGHMVSGPAGADVIGAVSSGRFTIDDLTLHIDGEFGGTVQLLDINGRLIYTGRSHEVIIPAHGVYVLRLGTSVHKIVI